MDGRAFDHFNEGGGVFGRGADTVIVFSRYDCPYCAAMLRELDSVLAQNPDAFTIRLRHFAHPAVDSFAFLAGVAADCAGRQARFLEASLWLANNFDEFVLGQGQGMPRAVGIRDTVAFFKCAASDEARFDVFSDVIAGAELQATGTPTSLVRGYRINGIASSTELAKLARGE
jgi:protein-disulfide isomerase